MKFTQLLYKQHIGRAFRSLWQQQRKRSIPIAKAEEILTCMGFSVEEASKVVASKDQTAKIGKLAPSINVCPDWKERSCFIYTDNNVLQEGVLQACLLTKTLQIGNELPSTVLNLITNIPGHIDTIIKRTICTCGIYDAHQVLLPKLKDVNRPSWVFPRVYGIPSTRKMYNLSRKFLQLCESLNGSTVTKNRFLIRDRTVSTYVEKDNDLLQFSLQIELMMTSLKSLTQVASKNLDNETSISSIYPLHHTIGLCKTNIYTLQDEYPIDIESPLANIHTIFINHDSEEVKNLTELPVRESQIHARSMIKSFTVAAAYARQRFGLNVKELPQPIVVQCIQTDGQNFHFSVYQLNTLDIDGTEGLTNFWWSAPSIKLYDKLQYESGRPCLEGYNNEVVKRFFAFYKNN